MVCLYRLKSSVLFNAVTTALYNSCGLSTHHHGCSGCCYDFTWHLVLIDWKTRMGWCNGSWRGRGKYHSSLNDWKAHLQPAWRWLEDEKVHLWRDKVFILLFSFVKMLEIQIYKSTNPSIFSTFKYCMPKSAIRKDLMGKNFWSRKPSKAL